MFTVGEMVDVCVSLLIETEGMKTKMYGEHVWTPGPVIEHTSDSGGVIISCTQTDITNHFM